MDSCSTCSLVHFWDPKGKEQGKNMIIAGFISGSLLTLMISLNGELTKLLSPLCASFYIHLIGALASLLILFTIRKRDKVNIQLWMLTSGLFGGIAVALTSVSVNSPIGLSGTICSSFLGQILFSEIINPNKQYPKILLILLGSGMVIYG